MANSWGMYNLWCCLFVVWVAKLIILRYGGLRAYQRAIPFFLGMALGDCIAGSIGSILSILLNTDVYEFFSVSNSVMRKKEKQLRFIENPKNE